MTSRARVLLLLIAVLIAASNSWASADASDNLDVVLVMDSSGSMKKTDPRSLRKQAAKLFVSLLSPKDRVAVVSFSDKVEILRGFEAVGTDVSRKAVLGAIDRIHSRGMFTDIQGGLGAALALQTKEPPSGQRKIVILMTDGKVDTGSRRKDEESIAAITGNQVEEYKEASTSIFSMAFTKGSDAELLEHVAFKTGGYMEVSETSADLHRVFLDFFNKLKSPVETTISGNKFRLDESVSEATLIARKSSPDVKVVLVDPSGNEVRSFGRDSGFELFSTEAYDLITIKHPKSGEWSIKFSHGDGNKVVLITDLKLECPVHESFVSRGARLPVEMHLSRGDELQDDHELLMDTQFELVIEGPGESDHKAVSVTDDGNGGDHSAGDGIYSAVVAFDQPGSYKLVAKADGKSFSRAREAGIRVNDWWYKPKIEYRDEHEQGSLLVTLEAVEKGVPEVVAVEGELAGEGEHGAKPSFTKHGEAFAATLEHGLKSGSYHMKLKVKPRIDKSEYWIEFPDAAFSAGGHSGSEGHGIGYALLQLGIANAVIGIVAASLIYGRRFLAARRKR
ncbi:MAG: VWA domain-containing protein [Nitrospirae bacterium]|nr:VWA domain-containing protein [Nitrospirota bacterium]